MFKKKYIPNSLKIDSLCKQYKKTYEVSFSNGVRDMIVITDDDPIYIDSFNYGWMDNKNSPLDYKILVSDINKTTKYPSRSLVSYELYNKELIKVSFKVSYVYKTIIEHEKTIFVSFDDKHILDKLESLQDNEINDTMLVYVKDYLSTLTYASFP